MRPDYAADAHPASAQFLENSSECSVVQSQPTVLFRDGDTEQTHLTHWFDQLLRVYVLVIVFLRDRFDFTPHEISHERYYLVSDFDCIHCGCHIPLHIRISEESAARQPIRSRAELSSMAAQSRDKIVSRQL